MALTRITKGVIKPNENYDTHNINSTGIVTAIGLDVNGNGDISGNLSVGGVLTYEDVTSIDSIGIITARNGIIVQDDATFQTANTKNVVLDKSDNSLTFGHDVKANFGDSKELKIYHDANISRIQSDNDILYFKGTGINFYRGNSSEFFAKFIADGGAELYYDGTKKFETYQYGVKSPGHIVASSDGYGFYAGAGFDIEMIHDGSNSRIKNVTGNLEFQEHTSGDIIFKTTTSGTERLRITSAGRVGIGTDNTSGASGLTIYKDDTSLGNTVLIEQDGTGDAVLGFALKGTAAWQFGIDNSDADKFKVSYDGSGLASSTAVTLDRTGKVGVGTNNPTKLLELFGTDPTIKLMDSSGDAYALIEGDSADQGSIRFRADPLGAGANTHIRFDIDGDERVRIDSNGDVGINQTNPSQKLDVNGSMRLTGQIFQSVPADNWSQSNTFIELNGLGNLTHQGSYETCLTSNGYRNSSTQWTSYAINSFTGASQIRLNPQGYISFATEENKASGSTHTVIERLRISSTGRIQQMSNNEDIDMDSSASGQLKLDGNGYNAALALNAQGLNIYTNSGSRGIIFGTDEDEKVRIDTNGRFLIGHNVASGDLHGPQHTTNRNPYFQLHGSNALSSGAALISWKNSAGAYYAPTLFLAHSGSDTKGTNGILPTNGEFGSIVFSGDDGTDFVKGAMIKARLDGTPGNDDMPGRLEFYTTPDGGQVPVERLRIKSDGNIGIGQDSPAGKLHISSGDSGDCVLIIEADTDNNEEGDNPYIEFRQDGGLPISAIGHGLLSSDQNGLVFANCVTNGYLDFATGSAANDHTQANQRLRITATGKVNIGGDYTQTTRQLGVVSSAEQVATFEYNGADADGSEVRLYHNSSSPADDDTLGFLQFSGKNSADEVTLYSGITAVSSDVTNGTEDGILSFHTRKNGSFGERVRITSKGDIEFKGTVSSDGLIGEAYGNYFGLKHANQSYGSEYMILSNNEHTFISCTSGYNIYIRPSANASTHQTIFAHDNTTFLTNIVLDNHQLRRSQHHKGHMEGGYNNIGTSSAKTSPIYTIGSAYNPDEESLSNMYGIGFAHRTDASFISNNNTPGWGLYVASDGDARIFLNGSDGRIFASRYGRTSYHTGHLEGAHTNIGSTAAKSNPIYTIGSNYNPNESTLSNMYGVGYANGDNASFLPAGGWGMYVAADGDARIFIDATNGYLKFNGGSGAVHFTNGSWSGEHSGGKIQTHGTNMYFQNAGGSWQFRKTNGTAAATIASNGNYSASDLNFKKDVVTISNAVDTIKKLTGRSFTWKEDDTKSFGVIAQEVETVLPELVYVTEEPEGSEVEPSKMVNYPAFAGHFIEAIKELSAKIETLEQENTTLKARVTTLEGS